MLHRLPFRSKLWSEFGDVPTSLQSRQAPMGVQHQAWVLPSQGCQLCSRLDVQTQVGVGSMLCGPTPRCGNLARKQKEKDPDSEEALKSLSSLCEDGRVEEALLQMDQQGAVDAADSVQIYKKLLQSCTKRKSLAQAKRVHDHLTKNGLESNRYLGEYVVYTLVKCGGFVDGVRMFDRLSHRTVFTWTAIISGCTKVGQWQDALRRYRQMQEEGVQPNTYILVSLLKACGSLGDLGEGKRIHADVVIRGCESDVFVGTSLVDMYAKCGSIADAGYVFDRLTHRDAVSWNVMLAGYALHKQGHKVLQFYVQMQEEGVSPNHRTFVSVLQACSILAEEEESVILDEQPIKVDSLCKGRAIHAEAVWRGYESDLFVCTGLITMYAKCGSMVDAQYVFRLCQHDVVSWTAMIAGYTQQQQGEMALQLYGEMATRNVAPDDWTFACALQACGTVAEKEDSIILDLQPIKVEGLSKAKALHAEAAQRGYESVLFVSNSLVSLYAKCGSIGDARYVFDRLPRRDIVSWNTMLAGYAQHQQGEEALKLSVQMQADGMSADDWTFATVFQACSSLAEEEEFMTVDAQSIRVEGLYRGKMILAEASLKSPLLDVFVGNAAISHYIKCGSPTDAHHVFQELCQRDVTSWNIMLAGFAGQGQEEQALQLYAVMQAEGVRADDVTIVAILEACGNIGSLSKCSQIHHDIVQRGLQPSPSVATALVHAYGKCGSMLDARHVLDSLPHDNLWSWSALIAGYARQGQYDKSMSCFEEMLAEGLTPDGVTFSSLLSACSHAGMVEQGLEYFECMTRTYGISATMEHYGIMIDLLGRAGLFTKAEHFISNMPEEPTLPVWMSLLASCRKHGNVVLGRLAFEHAVRLQPKESSAYVLMSNVYAHAGMSESAKEIEWLRQQAGACKEPGQSWVEYEHQLHAFVVGDRRHPRHERLYQVLKYLSQNEDE